MPRFPNFGPAPPIFPVVRPPLMKLAQTEIDRRQQALEAAGVTGDGVYSRAA